MLEKIDSNSEIFNTYGYDYVGTLHVEKGVVKIENDIPFDTFLAAMHCIFPDSTVNKTILKNHDYMWSGKVIAVTALYINNKVVEYTKPSVWPVFPWIHPDLKKDWEETIGKYEFRLFRKK